MSTSSPCCQASFPRTIERMDPVDFTDSPMVEQEGVELEALAAPAASADDLTCSPASPGATAAGAEGSSDSGAGKSDPDQGAAAASATIPRGKALYEAPIYKSDEFRMYVFKILSCGNRSKHDWKYCPFAHPGEHARRRPLTQHK